MKTLFATVMLLKGVVVNLMLILEKKTSLFHFMIEPQDKTSA